MAIALRLNTRQQTTIATATRLPRYARNDKVGTHELLWRIKISGERRNSRVDQAGMPRNDERLSPLDEI